MKPWHDGFRKKNKMKKERAHGVLKEKEDGGFFRVIQNSLYSFKLF